MAQRQNVFANRDGNCKKMAKLASKFTHVTGKIMVVVNKSVQRMVPRQSVGAGKVSK
jgi:hypothetical protein